MDVALPSNLPKHVFASLENTSTGTQSMTYLSTFGSEKTVALTEASETLQSLQAKALGLTSEQDKEPESEPTCPDSVVQVLEESSTQSCASSDMGFWAINNVKQVKLVRKLGETIKSKVYVGSWRGVDMVAKIAKPHKEDETDFDQELLHEINMLSQLRHPDIVSFLGAQMQDPTILFLEYMPGGDLQSHYREKKLARGGQYVAPRGLVIRWSSAVARALAFLHARHIIHRDLKPMNLLMSRDRRDMKVTDFGMCKAVEPATCARRNSGGVGSWRYMAPEVARHQHYGEKADIFAFSLILFFMSAGKEPFHEKPAADWMLREYIHGEEPRPQACECQVGLQKIVADAWHVQPELRPAATELVERLSDITPLEPSCSGCTVA